MSTHVLIVGGGGREHAIAWKLMQSRRVDRISVAPGNGGTADNVPIAAADVSALLRWAKANKPDLTIVGPEAPLAEGIADAFETAGLRVFGPPKAAALIESSKIFAKQFMQQHDIATAPFEVFTDQRKAIGFLLKNGDRRLAIKADGLASGKGVFVTTCSDDAEKAVRLLMVDKKMGDAGSRIVIEQGLEGYELSLMAFADGRSSAPMLIAQDHKRAYDGDTGPNTGGMGAYTVPVNPDDLMAVSGIQKVIDGLREAGTNFMGVLYAGLMITPDGPLVLEYNARFGDPETQVVLPLLENDLMDVIESCLDSKLHTLQLQWSDRVAATVVMAAGGYPGPYRTGHPISGLDKVPNDVLVFHAGTMRYGNQIETAGGRVLSVTGTGPDLQSALNRAYEGVHAIHFEGAQYRTDIGAKALRGEF